MLRFPEPSAVFEEFADSALMFNLRISLPDISKAVGVQSDLRIAIFKALRAADIEIPFHQLDVNLRDAEAVKRVLSRLAQEAPSAEDSRQAADATTERSKRNRVGSNGD